MSFPLELSCCGIFHVDKDTIQVSLGCEDGNNDDGVAGEVWYSLEEVIKAPELADRATSQGMSRAAESDHSYHWLVEDRPTEKRSVSGKLSFFLRSSFLS